MVRPFKRSVTDGLLRRSLKGSLHKALSGDISGCELKRLRKHTAETLKIHLPYQLLSIIFDAVIMKLHALPAAFYAQRCHLCSCYFKNMDICSHSTSCYLMAAKPLQSGRAQAIVSCVYPEVIPSHEVDAVAFVTGHLSRHPVCTWALHPAYG